jgi:hypothetical protein
MIEAIQNVPLGRYKGKLVLADLYTSSVEGRSSIILHLKNCKRFYPMWAFERCTELDFASKFYHENVRSDYEIISNVLRKKVSRRQDNWRLYIELTACSYKTQIEENDNKDKMSIEELLFGGESE